MRSKHACLSLWLATLCCLNSNGLAPCVADDWLAFRGPTGQGIVSGEGFPLEWSETEQVRWYAPIEGLGWSSPVVKGDRIYVTTAVPVGNKHSLRLVCLDAKSGTLQWSQEVFLQEKSAPNVHKKNSHASPTPLIIGDRIFVHFGHEGIACLDLEGKKIWENREFRYEPMHGNGSSPDFVEGLIILTCDGSEEPFTLALDAKSGKEVWRVQRETETDRKFSFCTPLVIEVAGKSQIISAGSNIVQALEPKTGKVLWFAKFNGFSLTTRPLYMDGKVIIATGFMGPSLLAIDPTGSGDVTKTHIRWQHKGNVPNTPSLIGYGDHIIMVSDSGILSSLSIKDGKESWKLRLGGNYSASPTLVGDTLFVQSEEGEAIVLSLAGQGNSPPTEVARNSLPGRTYASYAIYQRGFLIRNEQGIYAIGE